MSRKLFLSFFFHVQTFLIFLMNYFSYFSHVHLSSACPESFARGLITRVCPILQVISSKVKYFGFKRKSRVYWGEWYITFIVYWELIQINRRKRPIRRRSIMLKIHAFLENSIHIVSVPPKLLWRHLLYAKRLLMCYNVLNLCSTCFLNKLEGKWRYKLVLNQRKS